MKIGLGTDLLGDMHQYQSDELSIRADIVGAFEVIRQATATGAEIVNMKRKLGVIAANAYADLLVVDGDPLKDIRVLTGRASASRGDEEWRVGASDFAVKPRATMPQPFE